MQINAAINISPFSPPNLMLFKTAERSNSFSVMNWACSSKIRLSESLRDPWYKGKNYKLVDH